MTDFESAWTFSSDGLTATTCVGASADAPSVVIQVSFEPSDRNRPSRPTGRVVWSARLDGQLLAHGSVGDELPRAVAEEDRLSLVRALVRVHRRTAMRKTMAALRQRSARLDGFAKTIMRTYNANTPEAEK